MNQQVQEIAEQAKSRMGIQVANPVPKEEIKKSSKKTPEHILSGVFQEWNAWEMMMDRSKLKLKLKLAPDIISAQELVWSTINPDTNKKWNWTDWLSEKYPDEWKAKAVFLNDCKRLFENQDYLKAQAAKVKLNFPEDCTTRQCLDWLAESSSDEAKEAAKIKAAKKKAEAEAKAAKEAAEKEAAAKQGLPGGGVILTVEKGQLVQLEIATPANLDPEYTIDAAKKVLKSGVQEITVVCKDGTLKFSGCHDSSCTLDPE